MAYVPVGAFIGENNTANAVNIPGVPSLAGIVGIGSREKTIYNEDQIRGEVVGEALTVAGTPPHIATLSLRSNRSYDNTTVYRNGNAISDSSFTFNAPFILGTAAGPFDVTVNNAVSVSLDGLPFVTIIFASGAPSTAVIGSQVTATGTLTGAGATATRAEIVTLINAGLAALTAAGYGAAYSAVATDATTGIRITSPNSGTTADVRVRAPLGTSALVTLFGAPAAANRDAQTIITLTTTIYNASSVYTADYVNINSTLDTLDQVPVDAINAVGSFPSTGDYEDGVDYVQNGNDVDWSVDTAATFTGTVAGTFDVSTNDNVRLSFDGRTAVTIDLNGLGSPPRGYANPATPAAATPSEIAANINAVVANNVAYGVAYSAVATVSGSFVVLTSPTEGTGGSVEILAPTSLSATLAIFGLQTASLPYLVVGTGTAPTIGSNYFVTYNITRPTADYNVQKRFFSLDAARLDLGFAGVDNPLMCAVEVAFSQGAQSVAVVQVNDSTLPGSPTRQQFATAIQATVVTDAVTDLVVLTTSLDVQLDVRDNVEQYSSREGQRWRQAWFGMARDTSPGDRNTQNTFIYRATRSLQVSPTSPGRGRYFMVSPPQLSGVSRTYTLPTGATETVEHDSTILAVAAAARRSSLASIADTLSKKALGGFNTADITAPWDPEVVNDMASQGVFVISFDAGNFAVLDPVSTEAGNGNVAAFKYDSCAPQKDNLTRKLVQAYNANLIGVVPTSVDDFIQDIKFLTGGVISGEIAATNIGPFRTAAGTIRGVSYDLDIAVSADVNDPTAYTVTYSFYLRFPALRIQGTFTVQQSFG